MRHRLAVVVGIALLIWVSSASAANYRFAPTSGTDWAPSRGGKSVAPNSSYTVYTGLADPSTLFYLAENDPPNRDDVVLFNGVEEQINDYLNISGLPLVGQRRFVSESTINNPDGSRTDAIRIRAASATGAPADLWPAGLYVNGIPVPNGAIGLGLNMPATLGGSRPMALQPGSIITGLSVEIMSDGVSSGQIPLPLASFISPSPSNWDGTLGLVSFDGANTGAVESEITVRITSTVPEPAGLGCLSVLAWLKRRTRVPPRTL